MLNTEVASIMKEDGKVYKTAEKSKYNLALSSEEKEIASTLDAWAKDIGTRGVDANNEIASLVTKTVQTELYNAPDELLDELFDRGSVGEFDDAEIMATPKNTLIAYDAAKGGNVDRSWIDVNFLRPTWRNKQVETDISYVDLRRNGFKTVSTLVTYATEALKNALFADVFAGLDAALTGGDQVFAVTGSAPTMEAMDKLTNYLSDQGEGSANIVALSKYIQAITRMTNAHEYMSDAMKDEFNRYGRLTTYGGAMLSAIPTAKKLANGEFAIPDKRIFGIAGKVGSLDMKGEVHTYETMDNNSEKIHIYVKDFTFGYAITNIENVAKITLSA